MFGALSKPLTLKLQTEEPLNRQVGPKATGLDRRRYFRFTAGGT